MRYHFKITEEIREMRSEGIQRNSQKFQISQKWSFGPFWSNLIIYMAFINVIKCTYKIWSHSEFIWAKKIKRKIFAEPIMMGMRKL